VENTIRALKSMLELAHPTRHVFLHHGQEMSVEGGSHNAETNDWIPPIQRTVATDGTGIPELGAHIEAHAKHLRASGDWAVRERARLESEVDALLLEALLERFHAQVPDKQFEAVLDKVHGRSLSPWEAVQQLVNGRHE
jgi:LAO/AO transport system kinase